MNKAFEIYRNNNPQFQSTKNQVLILAPKPCKVDNTQNSSEFTFNVNFNYVFICLPLIIVLITIQYIDRHIKSG